MKKFLKCIALLLLVTLVMPPIGVTAQEPGRYDPLTEGIVSEYYPVKDGLITGITPGTTVEKICSTCAPDGVAASSETVVTGTVLTYGNQTLTAIVTGDLNGDGALTITDMLMLKSAVLGEQLSVNAAAAGDLNYDGNVSVTDFLKAKAYLLGLEQIQTSPANRNMTILMPGESAAWNVNAFSYQSGSEFLLVDNSGRITAGPRTGSGFIYALDENGNIVDRHMVTVLSEPLEMSFEAEALELTMGQSKTLEVTFNHPVQPAVNWTSSDTAVVTVEDGTVTAKGLGKATITVSLENGQQKNITVTVMPPITELNIERILYKVKPGHTKEPVLLLKPMDSGEEIIWTSSDPAIATVSSDGVITGVTYGTVTVTATGKYSGLTDSCEVKVCDVKQVALTFDDGPAPRTDDLLDFLAENDIRVTFFLVGNRMSYYSSDVKREAAEGHELGYHSYDHSTQTALSSSRITSDFQKSDNHLYELTGKHFTVWRTPGGAYNNRVLNCVPLPHILWSDDTLDWQTRNAYSVYRAIITKAGDGDIILLHDLHGTTVDGAIMAMKEMNEGDYEFVTVTELLSRDGTPPENSKNYNRAP